MSLRRSFALLLALVASTADAVSITTGPSVTATPTQVTITWSTDLPSTTEVHYGTSSHAAPDDYAVHAVGIGNGSTRHSRSLGDIQPGVTYFYRLRSTGAAGPAAVSDEGTFVAPDDAYRPRSRMIPDGNVQSLAVLGDTLYFGGGFSHVGLRRGGGVVVSATTGALLAEPSHVEGDRLQVHVVIPDGNGGFYVGGEFQRVGGLARRNAAHILADGGVDPVWDPDVNGSVFALARSGTTVYLGGTFTTANGGTTRTRFAAVDATTGALTAFAPAFNLQPYAFAVSGTTLYVGGLFSSVDGTSRKGAAAFDLGGGTLTAWDPSVLGSGFFGAQVSALAVSGTTVYLGGSFTDAGDQPRANAAAVNASTGAALSWNANLNGTVSTLAVAGGTVYLVGNFTTVNGGTSRPGIAAFDATTATATAWDPRLSGSALSVLVSGSTVYVGGNFRTVNDTTPRQNAAAFDATTAIATAWDPSPNGTPTAMAIAGGSLYLGGSLSTINGGVARSGAAAVSLTTGELTAWDPRLETGSPMFPGAAWTLAGSGSTVYVGGRFSTVNGGTARSNAAAFDATTGTVTAWSPQPNGEVFGLAIDGASAYLGGSFTSVNGATARLHLAEVDLTAGTATAWTVTGGTIGTPSSLAVNGSTLYAMGGYTSSPAGNNRVSPTALDRTSGAPTEWNPAPSPPGKSVAFSGGTTFLGGWFTAINGGAVTRANLAAVDGTTGTDLGWAPPTNIPILSRLGLYEGALFLCGDYTQSRTDTYAVDPVTAFGLPFNPRLDQSCYDLAYHAGTRTLAMGGTFLNVGSVPQSHLVLLSLAPPVQLPDGGTDAGMPSQDGGSGGGGSADAGRGVDAGSGIDAGVVADAGTVTDGGTDAGSGTDGGGPGTGGPDAGPDDEPQAQGCGCTAVSAGGALPLLALLLGLRRRRGRS